MQYTLILKKCGNVCSAFNHSGEATANKQADSLVVIADRDRVGGNDEVDGGRVLERPPRGGQPPGAVRKTVRGRGGNRAEKKR